MDNAKKLAQQYYSEYVLQEKSAVQLSAQSPITQAEHMQGGKNNRKTDFFDKLKRIRKIVEE